MQSRRARKQRKRRLQRRNIVLTHLQLEETDDRKQHSGELEARAVHRTSDTFFSTSEQDISAVPRAAAHFQVGWAKELKPAVLNSVCLQRVFDEPLNR